MIGAVAIMLFACNWAQDHEPTDGELLKTFNSHRQQFEVLRQMVERDHGLKRVDDNWTDPADPSSIGITTERIAAYRRLFRELGILRGFEGFGGPKDIDFLAHCQGISVSGSSKGYCWRIERPEGLVPSIDDFRIKMSKEYGEFLKKEPNSWKKHVDVYRHIEGNWYLHFDS